jgi:ABC-type nitrate/sulfonate/bicarbonate transport system substrate-binding protein
VTEFLTVTRRSAVCIIPATVFGVLLSSCAKRPPNKLTVGGGLNVSMPLLLARGKGFFKNYNLEVEFKPLQSSTLAFPAVTANQIDVGIVTDANIALIGYAGYGDVRIIGSIMTKTDDAIVARRDAGISTPDNLRGKRIAYAPASSSEVFLNLFLDHYNMTVSDVNIVPMSPAAALVALQHGDVDAVSIWQPYRYNFAVALGDNGIQFQNDGIYPARIYLIASKDTLAKRAEDLKALFFSFLAASKYAAADPTATIALLGPEVGIDVQTLTAVWSEYQIKVGDVVDISAELSKLAQATIPTQPSLKGKQIPDYQAAVDLSIELDAMKTWPDR